MNIGTQSKYETLLFAEKTEGSRRFASSVNVCVLKYCRVIRRRGERLFSPLDAVRSVIVSDILIHGNTSHLFDDTRARVAYIRFHVMNNSRNAPVAIRFRDS